MSMGFLPLPRHTDWADAVPLAASNPRRPPLPTLLPGPGYFSDVRLLRTGLRTAPSRSRAGGPRWAACATDLTCLLAHSRPGRLDLCLHGIEIEARALLHRRKVYGGQSQLQ